MQLKTKLLVYITVPIALSVCISSYMTYRTHSAAMRHVIEKDIKATSFFVAENINLTISDIKNSFRVAAKSEIIKESLENTGQREHERVVAFFEAIKHVMPTITDVFLLDETGNIRASIRMITATTMGIAHTSDRQSPEKRRSSALWSHASLKKNVSISLSLWATSGIKAFWLLPWNWIAYPFSALTMISLRPG